MRTNARGGTTPKAHYSPGRGALPADVKRVINHPDKFYRVRVGDYGFEYAVLHSRGLLFVTAINKRALACR